MDKFNEHSTTDVDDNDLDQKQEILHQGIKDNWEDLRNYIHVQIVKTNLSQQIEAEDILNNTIVKVLENIERFDITHQVRPWLWRIAINEIYEAFRRNNREAGRLIRFNDIGQDRGDAMNKDEIFGLLSQSAESSEYSLNELLSLIKGRDRQALELFYVQGFKADEIGKKLGISEAAAWKRLSRARKKLRKAYEKRQRTSMEVR